MQPLRGRCDMLEVAEDSAGVQQAIDLRIKRSFPFVSHMMNGEAGNHSVELSQIDLSQIGERIIEIMNLDRNGRIAREAPGGGFEHCRREVDVYSFNPW